MRREQKRGIFTNKTVKKCPTCEIWCSVCKGLCKVAHGFDVNDQTVADWHPKVGLNRKKMYHYGFGSLESGQKFVFYAKKSHRHPKMSQKEINKMSTIEKRVMRENLTDDIRFNQIGCC